MNVCCLYSGIIAKAVGLKKFELTCSDVNYTIQTNISIALCNLQFFQLLQIMHSNHGNAFFYLDSLVCFILHYSQQFLHI